MDEKRQDKLKPSYWAVIPAQVRYDTDLRPNAKLIYGELTALAGADGYCWATDKYFAELFDLSPKTVSELINSLAKKGYIKIELGSNKNGIERHIYSGAFSVTEGYPEKSGDPRGGIPKNRETGIPKNREPLNDNNINITNTPISPNANKTIYGCDREILDRIRTYFGPDTELLQNFLDFAAVRKKHRKPIDTQKALTLLLNKLDRLSGGDRQQKMELIDLAIERSWLSFYPLKDAPAAPMALAYDSIGMDVSQSW